jgi:hypothetical protein
MTDICSYLNTSDITTGHRTEPQAVWAAVLKNEPVELPLFIVFNNHIQV